MDPENPNFEQVPTKDFSRIEPNRSKNYPRKRKVVTKGKIPGNYGSRLSVFEAQFLSKYLENPDGRACVEALSSLRGKEAAIRATEVLRRPLVRFHLEEQLEAQSARCLLTSDRIIQEIMRLATYNIKDAYDKAGELIPINELPVGLAAALEGFETEEVFDRVKGKPKRVTKYKFAKKQGPLQMLAEHLRLLVQKFEVTGANGVPLQSARVDLSDVSTALLEKIVAKPEPA